MAEGRRRTRGADPRRDSSSSGGLRLDTLGFKEKPVADHPLVEVQIEAAVSGNYPSLAHFVNNLQKSPGLFIVDEMTLTAQNQPVAAGHLRVNLHLRTFFRTA